MSMFRPASLVAAALALTACSGIGRTLRPEAFGPRKRMAVGTVTSPSKIRTHWTSVGPGPFGQTQMNDHGSTVGETAAVFGDTKAAALRALARSRSFSLVPESAVLSSPAYAAVRPSDGKHLTIEFIAPRGYKLLMDGDRVAQLARALRVDAAIVVSLDHTCTPGGTAKPMVMAGAYDAQGRRIWADYLRAESTRSLPNGAEMNASSLRPLLVEAVERGMRDLVRRLDDGVATAR